MTNTKRKLTNVQIKEKIGREMNYTIQRIWYENEQIKEIADKSPIVQCKAMIEKLNDQCHECYLYKEIIGT